MSSHLLVHGSWCGGWVWDDVAQRLQKGGHRVTVVDQLPSTGTDPAALGDLTADAHHVRVVLDTLDEPVVLVGHSYGGMVLTELADHPKVRHSVYLAAFWPQRGQSQLDLGQPLPPERIRRRPVFRRRVWLGGEAGIRGPLRAAVPPAAARRHSGARAGGAPDRGGDLFLGDPGQGASVPLCTAAEHVRDQPPPALLGAVAELGAGLLLDEVSDSVHPVSGEVARSGVGRGGALEDPAHEIAARRCGDVAQRCPADARRNQQPVDRVTLVVVGQLGQERLDRCGAR